MARRLRIAALIVLGTVVLVIAAGLIFSQTSTFRQWLRREVVASANRALLGELTVGGLDGNLFGDLIIRDVTLSLEGRQVMSAQQLTARYSLTRLLRRRLLLEELSLQGLKLHLERDERGWNVQRLLQPSAKVEGQEARASFEFAINLDDLEIADAAIDLIQPNGNYLVRNFNLRGSAVITHIDQTIEIDRLSFAIPDREFQLQRGEAQLNYARSGALDIDRLVLETTASALEGHGNIGAKGESFDVTLEVANLSAAEIRRLTGGDLPKSDLSGTIRLQGPADAVAVAGTAVKSDRAEVQLDGTVDLTDPLYGYDLRAALSHLDLAALLGPKQPPTDINGTVAAAGRGVKPQDLQAKFDFALDGSTIDAKQFDQLRAKGVVESQVVTLDAAARTADGNATVAGTVGWADQHYDLRLETEQFDPAPFVGRKELAGRINATVVARGRGFEPRSANGEATIALRASELGAIQVRSLEGDLRLADSILRITRLNLDSNAVAGQAAGEIALQQALVRSDASAATGTLQYDIRILDLAPLTRLANLPLVQGSMTIAGTAGGRIGALDVDANVTGKNIVAQDNRAAAIQGTIRGRALGAPKATAEADLRAQGLRAGGRLFRAAQVQGNWIQTEIDHGTATVSVTAVEDDRHRHSLRAAAEIEPLESRLTLQALSLSIADQDWVSTGESSFRWRDKRLTVGGLELRSNRGSVIRLSGEGGTTGTQNLDVVLTGVQLEPLLGRSQPGITGIVSARVHLGGTAAAPQLDATVEIADLATGDIVYQSARADLQLANGRAAVTANVVQAGANQLTLDAQLPVRLSLSPFAYELGESITGHLRAADIDLAFLDPLVKPVSDLNGILNADLTISGSLRQPDVTGPLSISGGRAYIVPAGLKYEPIELRAQIQSSAVAIESLRVESKGGVLSGSGNVERGASGVAGEIVIELKNFPMFDNRYGEGRTNGELRISGTAEAPQVQGRFNIERLVLKIPEKLPGGVRPPDPTIQVIGPGAPPPPPVIEVKAAEDDAPAPRVPPYERATIKIDVKVANNAWLRRSDADIELRGSLTISKQPEQPLSVSGVINTVRGWYTFQGRKFTVEEGEVSLSGQGLDPRLNVVAVYNVAEYTVRARIGGSITKPTIKLESEPSLDQADVLSVLLFGKPASDLSQGESQGLREQALSVASGYVAAEFRRSVANALGLDTLEISTGEGVASTSASVGKYITEDIFVSLSHKFAEENVEQLSIQYFLSPSWTVETTADTSGDSGIDIFWRRRF